MPMRMALLWDNSPGSTVMMMTSKRSDTLANTKTRYCIEAAKGSISVSRWWLLVYVPLRKYMSYCEWISLCQQWFIGKGKRYINVHDFQQCRTPLHCMYFRQQIFVAVYPRSQISALPELRQLDSSLLCLPYFSFIKHFTEYISRSTL